MTKYIVICLILCCIVLSLSAQYNERTILAQQAQQYMAQRQYTQAEQAWLNLLAKYPDDTNAVIQLFNLYLQINQLDKAERLLADNRAVVSETSYRDLTIQLRIFQGRVEEAWTLVQNALALNPQSLELYRTAAAYFSQKGFLEKSLELYNQARKTLKNPDLFIMEMANAAFSYRQYPLAIQEYIKLLEKQPENFWYIKNQCLQMLTENPDILKDIRQAAEGSQSLQVKELYAVSLNSRGQSGQALQIYAQLPADKLSAFANEQYAAGNDSLAIRAYQLLLQMKNDQSSPPSASNPAIQKNPSPMTAMNDDAIKLRLGELFIRQKRWSEAETTLRALVGQDESAGDKRFVDYSKLNDAYQLLAELAIRLNKPLAEVITYYQKISRNRYTKDGNIDYKLINVYFLYDYVDKADSLLKQMRLQKTQPEYLYYKYLIATARNQPDFADSLLNDLVILSPSSQYVNDLMTLNIILINLQGQAREVFLSAYKQRLRHQDSLAVRLLLQVADTTKDEEYRLLAADWAIQSGLRSTALELYEYAWQDELLKDYALLQKSRLLNNPAQVEQLAKDYLKANPNSVFSPGFRQILQKAPAGRPTF